VHCLLPRPATCKPCFENPANAGPACAACLEEQHLTETRVRAAFDFFDHDHAGLITETDVVQVPSRWLSSSEHLLLHWVG
jgi:hypothetical protein